MKHLSSVMVVVGIVMAGCKTPEAAPPSDVQNVFGTDNRQMWNDANPTDDFPFHSIGHLPMGCTGALVSSRLVLTAAHCLVSYNIGDRIYYRPHTRAGNGPEAAAIVYDRGSSAANPFNAEQNDWALLLLDNPSRHQRFRVWAFGSGESHNIIDQPAWLAGYSADLPDASIATGCAVRVRSGGVLYHDCDIQGGASGGPLYIKNSSGERLIIGVQSSHVFCDGSACPGGINYNINTANRAVDTLSFLDRFMDAYNTYP